MTSIPSSRYGGHQYLLSYARRFGVASSAGVTRKYGFSLANLMGTAGPDAFVSALAEGLDPAVHGDVVHVGGAVATTLLCAGVGRRRRLITVAGR